MSLNKLNLFFKFSILHPFVLKIPHVPQKSGDRVSFVDHHLLSPQLFGRLQQQGICLTLCSHFDVIFVIIYLCCPPPLPDMMAIFAFNILLCSWFILTLLQPTKKHKCRLTKGSCAQV